MLLISLFGLAAAQNYRKYCKDNEFCIYAGQTDSSTLVTVHSAAKGWFGFGVGDSMVTATMYVGWANTTGGFTLVAAKAKSHSQPTPLDTQNQLVTTLMVPKPEWAEISFSFYAPKVTSQEFIAAWSDNPPNSNIDSRNAKYEMHSGDTHFSADFSDSNSNEEHLDDSANISKHNGDSETSSGHNNDSANISRHNTTSGHNDHSNSSSAHNGDSETSSGHTGHSENISSHNDRNIRVSYDDETYSARNSTQRVVLGDAYLPQTILLGEPAIFHGVKESCTTYVRSRTSSTETSTSTINAPVRSHTASTETSASTINAPATKDPKDNHGPSKSTNLQKTPVPSDYYHWPSPHPNANPTRTKSPTVSTPTFNQPSHASGRFDNSVNLILSLLCLFI